VLIGFNMVEMCAIQFMAPLTVLRLRLTEGEATAFSGWEKGPPITQLGNQGALTDDPNRPATFSHNEISNSRPNFLCKKNETLKSRAQIA